MYIWLNQDNVVGEIIPGEDPIFPGIPIEERYEKSFVDKLLYVDDSVEVRQNWVYNEATGEFSEPMPDPVPEETENAYQDDERLKEET